MTEAHPRKTEPGWLLPDEPLPLRLMNTVWADRLGVHDAMCTPDDLSGWLTATGLSAGAVTTDDVAAFRGLRDALRRLAALLTDDPRPAAASHPYDLAEAVGVVNRAADASPSGPRLRLLPSGLEREDHLVRPAGALAAIASQAIELLTGDRRPLLRACLAPGCVLYYVRDHPRRGWCSTACGNRARAARHYQRHRTGSRATT